MRRCKGPCKQIKSEEAFEIRRGRPKGEGYCYACTKLMRVEDRKMYTRNYYRKYRQEHPEETLKAQMKAKAKIKERRQLEKEKNDARVHYERNFMVDAQNSNSELETTLRRLDSIGNNTEETSEALELAKLKFTDEDDKKVADQIEQPNPMEADTVNTVASKLTHVTATASETSRERVVRDTYSMPTSDYNLVADVKLRCLRLGLDTSRSEIVRAGVKYLSNIQDDHLKKVLSSVTRLKPGRATNQS